MALEFLNIRSGERRIADSEPKIAALWSSSDHSPNITQGQDFGWRLAPAVVVEMKQIKQDMSKLSHIAQLYGKLIEDVNEPDILTYISQKTSLENVPQADKSDYEDEYDAEIRKLEQGEESTPVAEEEVTTTKVPSTTTTTTEDVSTTTTTTKKS